MRFALWVMLALALPVVAAAQPAAPVPGIAMVRVAGRGPVLDAEEFATARVTRVATIPQLVTTPMQAKPATAAIEVRAVRNDDHAGFLLEWEDASADVRTAIDHFGDMAAVALPVAEGVPPSPMMGNPGGRVQILQWRADWQTDVDRGPLTLRELYPNAYQADFHHADHLPEATAAPFLGPVSLGNPMSAPRHTSSVQDLMAEGFGSLTPRAVQSARGWARHDGTRWHVVITRPLAPSGESSAAITPGTTTQLAFAVWNGGQREVGSRKGWASWVPLEVPR